jgi:RimJ/RimL family protein N-acetyltransferase
VLSENVAMGRVCRKLGFRFSRSADDPSIIHMSLPLDETTPSGN